MKNKFLSLLLLFSLIFSCTFGVTACDEGGSSSSSSSGPVDYVANLKLDMNSETLKQVLEPEDIKMHIDGDTTHFYVPTTISETGVLKARYLAVNTPESTGRIEPWGKKASNFTKSKLQSADSIILETDGTKWDLDSTGARHLVWVWYRPAGATDYRNLNLEILQNGLAIPSSAGSTRYGSICQQAIAQATAQELYVHSSERDPDFYYGGPVAMTLKELRMNIKDYEGVLVSFEGVATYQYNNGYYFEDYDADEEMYYGIYVYLGNGSNPVEDEIKPGNKVRVVGKITNFNGSYQISDVSYDPFLPWLQTNTVNIDPGNKYPMGNLETSADMYTSTRKMAVTVDGVETTKDFYYTELAMQTTISMKNLRVTDIYTTTNPASSSKGAMTLTCYVGTKKVVVRTLVLYDKNGNLITEKDLLNKTIDVQGVVDYYSNDDDNPQDGYQIKVLEWEYITVH